MSGQNELIPPHGNVLIGTGKAFKGKKDFINTHM
jgi:hypothetical protein